MAEISAQLVKDLREKSQAGMMDCKKALVETNGDFEKAIDWLKQKGLSKAGKAAGRIASEGAVGSYIHAGGKIGVLVEVNCETDFVAKNEDFKALVQDIAMHIAAANPISVRREDIAPEVVERERAVFKAQVLESGKPAAIADKIVEGKVDKFLKEQCLLEQQFVKNPDITIQQLITERVAKIGENLVIRRFARFQLGEGIQKKTDDFATEVAKIAGTA
jgi:elongation factor Ts